MGFYLDQRGFIETVNGCLGGEGARALAPTGIIQRSEGIPMPYDAYDSAGLMVEPDNHDRADFAAVGLQAYVDWLPRDYDPDVLKDTDVTNPNVEEAVAGVVTDFLANLRHFVSLYPGLDFDVLAHDAREMWEQEADEEND